MPCSRGVMVPHSGPNLAGGFGFGCLIVLWAMKEECRAVVGAAWQRCVRSRKSGRAQAGRAERACLTAFRLQNCLSCPSAKFSHNEWNACRSLAAQPPPDCYCRPSRHHQPHAAPPRPARGEGVQAAATRSDDEERPGCVPVPRPARYIVAVLLRRASVCTALRVHLGGHGPCRGTSWPCVRGAGGGL